MCSLGISAREVQCPSGSDQGWCGLDGGGQKRLECGPPRCLPWQAGNSPSKNCQKYREGHSNMIFFLEFPNMPFFTFSKKICFLSNTTGFANFLHQK